MPCALFLCFRQFKVFQAVYLERLWRCYGSRKKLKNSYGMTASQILGSFSKWKQSRWLLNPSLKNDISWNKNFFCLSKQFEKIISGYDGSDRSWGKAEFYSCKDLKYLKYPIFERQLFVIAEIDDEHGEILDSLKEALRDAAISGYRFVHCALQLEEMDVDSVVAEMKEKGSFVVSIKSISYAHQITLPNAPVWSWRWND